MDIALSYSDFKNKILNTKLYWQYVTYTNPSRYFIWALEKSIVYTTELHTNPSELNGWDEERKTLEANNVTDFETNYKDSANRNSDISPTSSISWFEGKTIEIAAEDTTGYCEWTFDHDVLVAKILPIPIDAEFGDKINLEVYYGETKVGQYGSNIYFYQGRPDQWFYGASGCGKVPVGCAVRCTYTKATGTARKFIAIGEFLI